MNRKNFIELLTISSGAAASASVLPTFLYAKDKYAVKDRNEYSADVIIAGGGLGGCASALVVLRNHGGAQLYRDFRNAIREYCIRNYPSSAPAKPERENLVNLSCLFDEIN